MAIENFITKKLDWDTSKFGLEVYQLTMNSELDGLQWIAVLDELEKADLVYIKNLSTYRQNSINIAKHTRAFIIDTNITLSLNTAYTNVTKVRPSGPFEVLTTKDFTWNINELLEFEESRFVKDIEMMKLGGSSVYRDWVHNSKNKPNKNFIFVLSVSRPIGVLLYSVQDMKITIELISVLSEYKGNGIGKLLIDTLKNISYYTNIKEIVVGTQVSNISAMNFYINNGFHIENTTDIYHWWK